MSTGYTPIPPPSFSPPTTSAAADFISRTQSITSKRRPWPEFFSLSSLSPPFTAGEATHRLSLNLSHFHVNYTIIILLFLFLSLIWHPVSVIVFLIVLVAWLYLYISRDEPLIVFNRTVDDRVVVTILSIVTVFALVLTRVWLNVLVSVLIGAAVVVLHAIFRFPYDGDDMESPYGALNSVVDSPRGAFTIV